MYAKMQLKEVIRLVVRNVNCSGLYKCLEFLSKLINTIIFSSYILFVLYSFMPLHVQGEARSQTMKRYL